MGFFDREYTSMPWMARVNPDAVITFEIDVRTMDETESTVPFGKGKIWEAQGKMRNIVDAEGDEFEEDGEHKVPFWACARLQGELNEKDKWVKMQFHRTTTQMKNQNGDMVDYSEPHFERG